MCSGRSPVFLCDSLPLPVRDASSTGSLSLCSSTPVIVSMEESAFSSVAYLLRSSPRNIPTKSWQTADTAASLNLCMGAHTGGWAAQWEPSLRTGAASRRCNWGSPGTRRQTPKHALGGVGSCAKTFLTTGSPAEYTDNCI